MIQKVHLLVCLELVVHQLPVSVTNNNTRIEKANIFVVYHTSMEDEGTEERR